MNTTLQRMRAGLRRHRIATTAGVAVALVGLGAGVAVAAPATSPSTTTVAASTRSCAAPGVGRLLKQLPAGLKADLKALRHDTPAERTAARAAIRAKALDGGYGMEIERVARIAANDGGKLVAALPASLKADLKILRADAKGSSARKAEAAEIWSKALAGDYGTNIESLAKNAETRIQAHCDATPSGTASSSAAS